MGLHGFLQGYSERERHDSSVGIATGYGLDGGVVFPAGTRNFSLLHIIQTGSEARQPQWVPGVVSAEVKRPEREANLSPPSSVEFKNGGAVTPLPHTSSKHSA
jgi:hypothetical protein